MNVRLSYFHFSIPTISNYLLPSTPTLIASLTSIINKSFKIVDNYQVFKLEKSSTVIWQSPGIILTNLGSGHLAALIYSRPKFSAKIQILAR